MIDRNEKMEQIRRAALLRRMQETHGEHKRQLDHLPLRPTSRERPLPLSFAQQRLWFLDQLNPDAMRAYHMPYALRLKGRLDGAALQATMDRVLARHEVLRTRFAMVNGEPVQVVDPVGPGFALCKQDLRTLPPAERAGAIERMADAVTHQRFDLSSGPLFRGQLLQLDEQDHLLLLTLHHIVSDGWSTGLLVQEVSELYAAFSQGQADPLPALPIQYADYAAWQRQWLQGETLQKREQFWKTQLQGAPELLGLPTDRPRPAVPSFAGASVPVHLPAELCAGLQRLAQQHRCTLFMVLLAGWTVLLSRMSRQDDLVIGTPVANRPRRELESLMGFFVNMLPLRMRLQPQTRVADLLEQVKTVTLDAQSHQDLSFDQIVNLLNPTRNPSHSVIFQAGLSLENVPVGELVLPDLTLSVVEQAQTTSPFDLFAMLSEQDGGIKGSLNYATDLFDAATIERAAQHYSILLAGMVADPQQPVHRLPLLDTAERERVLHGFNATAAPLPETLIHTLFEQQAARTPDATALVFENTELSYAELNARANRLAHHLISLGVHPDSHVAIALPRCADLVVAWLATLKAGGAYVPLDTQHPPARLGVMLEDCAPVVLLTHAALQPQLHSRLPALPVLALDGPSRPWDSAPTANPDPKALGLAPEHLAYVIYTSGSTGAPKGVMVAHRNVLRLVINNGYVLFDASARVAFAANPAFDASTMEVWAPLLTGGCVVIFAADLLLEPVHMARVLQEQQVTTLFVTTALFNQYAQAIPDALAGLRHLLCGGERNNPESFANVLRRGGPRHLIHCYGPTETTTFAITHEVSSVPDGARSIPLGRPIGNTRVYILDAHGEPLPVGVPGELYIGGAGVARGYLNRPELTAERFLRDPFSPEPGARMYRTGDLGRWLPDGTIDFLGRNDQQVKIRGFRIEPGEIEVHLAEVAGVREAVVLAREDAPGVKRLVAYLTGDVPPAETLRAHLAAVLPDYMVPAAYVTLDALPLTPNGKLDRRALPAPEAAAFDTAAYEAPQPGQEQALAELWSELLGLPRIGRHDNFFALGGHSLLAVQLVSRLRAHQGVELALAELFAHPTLAALASRVATARADTLPPLTPVPRDAPLPLSFAQQRLWFLEQLDQTVGIAYHMPVALRLNGPLNLGALQASLDRVVARHEILRTRFVTADGKAVQAVEPADVGFTCTVRDLRHLPPDERDVAAMDLGNKEVRAPFDLARGPLIRGMLLQMDEQKYNLLITQHHIISDGWSGGLLLRELNVLYAAFSRGLSDPLPALPVQYADYASWQRQSLQSEALQRQENYWKAQLQDAPERLDLPTEQPYAMSPTFRGGVLHFEVPAPFTAALQSCVQVHNATLFMGLAAAFSVLLSRHTGQDDLCVGTPTASRPHAVLEKLMGFFSNTLVLRIRPQRGLSFEALLAQVRQTALDAYANQDLPFEQVVAAVDHTRRSGRMPLFQVMLTLLNAPMPDMALDGLHCESLPIDTDTAKVDIALLAEPMGGGGLACSFEYSTDLFSASYMEELAEGLVAVIEAVARSPQQALDDLNLLPPRQRVHLLNLGQGVTAPQRPAVVHAAFEALAVEQPDAPALIQDAQLISYAELNRRANRVAHALVAAGVRPDSLVALFTGRGVDWVVGVLAILKSGGAYVPLDPDYPSDRLAFMFDDSRPRVLLTQASLEDQLPACRGLLSATVLNLDVLDASNQYSDDNPDPSVIGLNEHHLAYVVYTSGSTGQPKGVMVEHAGLCNLSEDQNAELDLGPGRRVLQFASPSFDASTWEIVMALCSGAALVLGERKALLPGAPLLELLRKQQVTHALLPPSALAMMEDDGTLESMTLIAGGEACPPSVAQHWGARHRLVNAYGPSEITVCATTFPWKPRRDSVVPIGRPNANTSIYVLDEAGQLAPLGARGEIHIGGAGVARGYLHRRELTAERFLRDPFAVHEGARMYRTGDIGRWLPDGQLQFLGRNDFQVKIRGFRIETGEIETKLVACVGVREAVVLAREDFPGDRRLVAYVVPQDGVLLSVAVLRESLASVLPDFMLPSAFVLLDAFPLTSNGKLDRIALPAPDAGDLVSRVYEAPKGGVEEALAQIWADVLKLDRVGRHDNFFELGGHSLLAITLIERIRRLGWALDVRALFTTPNLAGLAASARATTAAVGVPPNLIAAGCPRITPDLLPLVTLEQSHIDGLIATVPGGAPNVQDIYPLAPLQEGLLFHHLLDPQADPYVHSMLLAFDSRERMDRFMVALQSVIDRHDILRTAIAWQDLPQPVQVVWRHAPLALIELELSGTDVGAELQAPKRRYIDVRQAPLMRAEAAADPAHSRWLLTLQMHHLITERTTDEIIIAEVQAHLAGRAQALPEPLPFRNFVGQARQGAGEALHEAFFRRMLADVTEPTAPYGLLNARSDGLDVSEQHLPVPAGLAQELRRHARRLGVSSASLFHLAYARVLASISGRDDVVFGTVLFGRLHGTSGSERALGLFINTLPLRLRVDATPLEQAALETHARLAELLQHEHASLVLAQRASGVPAHQPLFSALLNFRHDAAPTLDASPDTNAETDTVADWQGIQVLNHQESSNYPLTLSVNDTGTGFFLAVKTDPHIDAADVGNLVLQVLQQIAQQLEQAPQAPLNTLAVLPTEQRERLLQGFNNTAAPLPEVLVHTLFEQQVVRTPEAIALVFENTELSYAALNARANRLAHHLIGLGLGPDQRVALCLERGIGMVVALLATLKAGAAYVPLDPTYPPERLAFMLADCESRALLTEAGAHHALGTLPGNLQVIELDAASPPWASLPATNPDPTRLTPSNLAYVIYTSGSTGTPKGVMVEHRSAVNFWQVMSQTTHRHCPPHATVALNAAFSFDMSLKGILQLLSGHTLVLIPQVIRASGAELLDFLAAHRVDAFDTTPSQLEGLLAAGLLERSDYAPVSVLVGGEAIQPALWDRLRQSSVTRFYNMYGPTECTVDATIGLISELGEQPNIGRVIANTRIYILDAQGQPVPLGVPGEIHIGGVQVARGYLKRPELTAARFLPDPFSPEPCARMYRTGDLGRWLPNGTIAFLGRNDHQVKLRGFRIELGEIETRLMDCAGVRQAVVLVREDQPGDQRLLAYLVPQEGVALSAAALRRQLAESLADHMLPGAFVLLDALPLTPNGKLDRRALLAMDLQARGTRDHEPPRGEVELAIAQIWQDLLATAQVGRHDNFLEIGGHSLLAVQVIVRLRKVLGVKISLREFFSSPTVAALARCVVAASRAPLPPIEPVDRSQLLPLSFAQQRLWFLDRLDRAAGAAYHMPAALRLRGSLHREALQAALDRIVARHESLRTCFVWDGDTPAQVVAPPDSGFALARHDLRDLPAQKLEAAVQRLSQAEALAPFDLSTGPLIRGQLLQLGEQEHILLVTQHHIISDGWSIGLLVRELSTLYAAFSTGQADPLPALPIQYADYAAWQRQWLQGEVLHKQVEFWKQHLHGAPALLELPTDRPRPAVQSYAGAMVSVQLPAELSAGLRQLSRKHGCTLFMTLQAGWAALLSRLSPQDDIVIGTPVANRQRTEVESLVGFFVNTLALRVRVDESSSVDTLLQQVKDTTVAAYGNQDLPFERVVEALQPRRSLGHSPVFQVMLSLNNTPGGDLAMPGLELGLLPQVSKTAQFDLSVSLTDDGELIRGELLYASDLFDAGSAQRMAAQWQELLAGMVGDVGQSIGTLCSFLPARPTPAPEAATLASAALRPPYQAPQGRYESAIADVWMDLLECSPVGRHDDFFALGGVSLMAVRMLSLLRKSLGRQVTLRDLFANPTLAAFASLFDADQAPPQASCLVPMRPAGLQRPLYLVHPVGGQIQYVRNLANWLDADIPVYGLVAAGFAPGETPVRTLPEMAANYINAIRRVQPEGPYRLAGWSGGGMIAYEMARQLIDDGTDVEFLGLIDTSPDIWRHRPADGEAAQRWTEANYAMEWLPSSLPDGLQEQFKRLAAANELTAMMTLMIQHDLLPPGLSRDVDADELRLCLSVAYATQEALFNYVPMPIDLPVTLFAAAGEGRADSSFGWWQVLGRYLTVIPAKGTHMSMVEPTHAMDLAIAMSDVLAGQKSCPAQSPGLVVH